MRYIILFIFIASSSFAQTTLKGKIIDKANNEPIIGAVVYFPDIKTGCVSDKNGMYNISNLPKLKLLVQVSFIGYSVYTENIDLSKTNEKIFELESSFIEVNEIVITGSAVSSDKNKSSVSIVTINKNDLKNTPGTNIINALSNIPGLSEVTTGGDISKPVIRGLGYNHVVILNEGVRQEGNQWGDEHGIEIDQFSVDRIEILKGPASLLYGSDAMGGVLNILEPIPAPFDTKKIEVLSNYSTNNKLTSSSLMFEGNKKGFVWHARSTYKNSASYQTPTEYVYNSGFHETNYNIMLGLHKSWGYSHLYFSNYNSFIGMIEGVKDSISNKFIDINGIIVPDDILKSRTLEVPFQNINHTKFTSVNNFIIAKGQLKVNAGYQTNNRKEFAETKTSPNLFFHLTTATYDVKYQFKELNNFENVIGFSGMSQKNENKGNEFLVPDYRLQDFGGFAFLKKNYKKLTYNLGLRFDTREIIGEQLLIDSIGFPSVIGDTLFKAFNTNISAFSGAIGITYAINKAINLKANIGKGYRAPNIAELGSNGVHEGTFRYELGNSDLKPETSTQFDIEISAQSKKANITFDGFYNIIDNYIYYRNLNNEKKNIDGTDYPVYRYIQGNSLLYGFEVSTDFHIIKDIHFENSISYVKGENLQTHLPLPLIPALHSKHLIKWNIKTKSKLFINTYILFCANNYLKQNRYDIFETETKGYTLLDMGLGTDIKLFAQTITAFINVSNITNVKYYDHLNRLKYSGIYNMGRNITFGFNLPINI